MNRFTVEYIPEAENELARLWLSSDDPQAFAAASNQIDDLLARDPVRNGRLLSEGLYRLEVPPLIVTYSIDDARQYVEVNSVRCRP
jgi:hypothetical protein